MRKMAANSPFFFLNQIFNLGITSLISVYLITMNEVISNRFFFSQNDFCWNRLNFESERSID